MEVPDLTLPRSPVPTAADRIETPGAVTFGRSAESPVRGPDELKPATLLNSGLVMESAVSATSLSCAAMSASPSEDLTPSSGTLTRHCSPVSGLPVISPS